MMIRRYFRFTRTTLCRITIFKTFRRLKRRRSCRRKMFNSFLRRKTVTTNSRTFYSRLYTRRIICRFSSKFIVLHRTTVNRSNMSTITRMMTFFSIRTIRCLLLCAVTRKTSNWIPSKFCYFIAFMTTFNFRNRKRITNSRLSENKISYNTFKGSRLYMTRNFMIRLVRNVTFATKRRRMLCMTTINTRIMTSNTIIIRLLNRIRYSFASNVTTDYRNSNTCRITTRIGRSTVIVLLSSFK